MELAIERAENGPEVNVSAQSRAELRQSWSPASANCR